MSQNYSAIKTLIGGAILILALVVFYYDIGLYREGEPEISVLESNVREESKIVSDGVVFEVVKVIDGDTILVRNDGKNESVRLIGIDTPEVETPYTKEECFGVQASERLTTLLQDRKVVLKSDEALPNKDKYDRLLRYLFLPDGSFVNALLVEEGYALVYRFEPFEFKDLFISFETDVKESRLGLWGDGCDYYDTVN